MNLYNPTEIKDLLSRHGFRFSKAMGQNFLIDESVPERIAEMSGIDGTSAVLEIGPGIGALTGKLSPKAGKVVAIELDKALPPVLKETLADCANVEILSGDVLKTDLRELVSEKFAGFTPCVCANLPYNITSPVLTKLLESRLFDTVTVMIQKEVAQRIVSKPAKSEYGAFTVFVNYYTEPQILFDVPPCSFVPQPKVTSSVIKLTKRKEPVCEIRDEKLFFKIVRASFAQRRKTLVNGLSAAFPLPKEEITKAICDCGFDANVRGETLGIPEFAALCDRFYDLTAK